MNWDYISGFFDGEGNFSIYYDKNKKIKYQLAFSQANKEVLDDIQQFLGVGKVYKADHKGNKNWKESWLTAYSLRINKRADILFILEQIENNLIVKKEEVKTKKKILEKLDYLKKNKWEKTRAQLKICKDMRNKGQSWKDIGKVINKNPESARCFVKFYKNRSEL